MKIRDITIDDILACKNWRLSELDVEACLDLPMEECGPLAEVEAFAPNDRVIYSGITVYPSGRVVPIVCIREVQYLDYGGDYCEFVDGAWHQLGLEPSLISEVGDTYIADPLFNDPSFNAPDHDHRRVQRDGFARHAHGLRQ